MSEVLSNNKRIARNTLFLYVRMLLVFFVNLFVVRIVLDSLGAEEYGLYNVVAGIVTVFSFLTSMMSSASLRFFSFELGRNDKLRLNQFFNVTCWCYVLLALIVVVLAESLGLWFLQTKLSVPVGRESAVVLVYHLSIISFVSSILAIPFNSIIIAHECMDLYAYVGLLEVLFKLLIAFFVRFFDGDRFILYGFLLSFSSVLVSSFYICYVVIRFSECRIRLYWDKKYFKEIFSYSIWSLFGTISGICRDQGINILLNIFFGSVVNAARAIAFQVQSAINGFVVNFYKAVQPQITKYYASGKRQEMTLLIYRSSRFSFYLISFFAIPIFFEARYILLLWLKIIPDNTVFFVQLIMIISVIESLSHPLQTAISSTGKIKNYQIVTGFIYFLNLPISFLFLKFGFKPEVTMIIAIFLSILAHIIRIVFVNKLILMPVIDYIKNVVVQIFCVFVLSCFCPLLVTCLLPFGIVRFLTTTLLSAFFSLLIVWFVGINKNERRSIELNLKKIASKYVC